MSPCTQTHTHTNYHINNYWLLALNNEAINSINILLNMVVNIVLLMVHRYYIVIRYMEIMNLV